jgi:hypothetical protein
LKTISLSEFKKLTSDQIKEGPCLEITSNCEHLAFLVVGSQEGMRDRISGISSQIDAGRGKEGK